MAKMSSARVSAVLTAAVMVLSGALVPLSAASAVPTSAAPPLAPTGIRTAAAAADDAFADLPTLTYDDVAQWAELLVNGEDVERDAAGVPFNTFGGFGSVSCNNTSNLLLDYKEEQPEVYWRIMHLLFDPQTGAGLKHIKVELGADNNTSSGAEPATKRIGRRAGQRAARCGLPLHRRRAVDQPAHRGRGAALGRAVVDAGRPELRVPVVQGDDRRRLRHVRRRVRLHEPLAERGARELHQAPSSPGPSTSRERLERDAGGGGRPLRLLEDQDRRARLVPQRRRRLARASSRARPPSSRSTRSATTTTSRATRASPASTRSSAWRCCTRRASRP